MDRNVQATQARVRRLSWRRNTAVPADKTRDDIPVVAPVWAS
ncbi:MAG: hypothetical protein ACK4P5_07260 [Fimbriimonadales bacterium]